LPSRLEWRSVAVHGRYVPDETILVRNRQLNGDGGYEVLVPLRVDPSGPAPARPGRVLMVDRGWIPAGASAAGPDSVPAAPTGDVDVVARLKPSEGHEARTPPPGQALKIDLPTIGRTIGEPLGSAYGVLVSESPAPAQAPAPLPEPDVGLGVNLAYAVQWVAFAIAAYVMLAVAAVREVRRRAGPSPDPTGGGSHLVSAARERTSSDR
jgi:cytochrome oxidase assembly protein ShyY1